jgi:hypothetical protein
MQEPSVQGRRRATAPAQLIDTYLGRQIFLKRVIVEQTDRGVWLHWSHPQDQGCPNGVKYGHFVAPGQALEQALGQVYQTIEASIELELISSNPDYEPIDPPSFSSTARSSSGSGMDWMHLAS